MWGLDLCLPACKSFAGDHKGRPYEIHLTVIVSISVISVIA